MNTQIALHSTTWLLTLHLLKTLKLLREDESHKKSNYRMASINSSIIINCATLIEGCVKELLYEVVNRSEIYRNALQQKDTLTINVFKNTMSRLLESSWDPLQKQAPLFIQGDLKSFYEKDWDSIKKLFLFRNILAHGNNITYMIDIEKDLVNNTTQVSTDWTCRELKNFLLGKKLITDDGNPSQIIIQWQFFKNEVADYFLMHSKNYLINFLNQPYSKSKHLINDLNGL